MKTIPSTYDQNNRNKSYDNQKIATAKRTQFILIFVVCFAILLYQIGQCVHKFSQANTATADKYVHVSMTNFPELTICPAYPYDLKQLAFHNATRSGIQWNAQWISSQPGALPDAFFEDVVLPLDEVVKSVNIYLESEVDGQNHLFLEGNATFCGERLYKEKPYYYNGNCFAFVLPSCLHEAGTLELVFRFHNQTDIFIHHPGQFLNPNSRARVDVEKGYFVKIAISHEIVQLLSDKSNCIDKFEGHDNSFDGCMYAKLYQLQSEQVGCTVPWLLNRSNICIEEEKRNSSFSLYQLNRRNQNNICSNSCLFTNMYFGPPVTGTTDGDDSEIARAVLYFKRDIKTTDEYYLYSALSMLAEIGGYVGLLMGVSLFKLTEINNFFLDIYANKKESQIEAESKEEHVYVVQGHNKTFSH